MSDDSEKQQVDSVKVHAVTPEELAQSLYLDCFIEAAKSDNIDERERTFRSQKSKAVLYIRSQITFWQNVESEFKRVHNLNDESPT